ncbi:hypothetical protein K3718_20385 (plasmid) [Leisingera aquaemixtae]|uniref:Uncharacterized protein n=1 Tax=Leisingera aquaemixtae TaxID=1396826 RepID=A0ABY5WR05_9RHOB|nr:hypothetical protein [Leisingera aquaemixtae]UWQ43850.1 hypothetical protein K3718_20385 [Leisingera aquaemixtae]
MYLTLFSPALAQTSWRFETDSYGWFGYAAVHAEMDGDNDLVALRCSRAGAPNDQYPGDRTRVSLFDAPNDHFTLLVSGSVYPQAAQAGQLTNVEIEIDGMPMGASQMLYLEPERAFAAFLPGTGAVVAGIEAGGVLSVRLEGAGNGVALPLDGAGGALATLMDHCSTPWTPAPPSGTGASNAGEVAAADEDGPSADNCADPNIPAEYLTASGRIRATGSVQLQAGILPEPQQNLRERVARVASLMALRAHSGRLDEILEDDIVAHDVLYALPDEDRRAITLAAIGAESADVTRLDAFQSRALADGVREALPAILDRIAPTMPMQLEVVCPMHLGNYNFDIEAFPFSGVGSTNHHLLGCGDLFQGIPLFVRQSDDLRSVLDNFPETLAMLPDDAQELFEAMGRDTTAVMRFNAELSVDLRVIRDDPPYLNFTLMAQGPYRLASLAAPETVLHTFVAAPPPTSEELLQARRSGDIRWFSQNAEDRVRLIGLAEPISGQTQGPIDLFKQPNRLGRLGFRMPGVECDDAPGFICPLGVDWGGGDIAAILGIPTEQFYYESFSAPINGLGGVVLLLPAPKDLYRLARPNGVEASQYTDMVVELAFSGAWLLDDPSLENPVLVLSGVPQLAEFVSGREFTPYAQGPLPQPDWQVRTILAPPEQEPPQAGATPEFDIMGITLGMPVDQAREIVEARMQIGWTGTSKEQTRPTILEQAVTALVSADGTQQVRLIEHPHDPGYIVAASRTVVYSAPNTVESVASSLIEKYGAPSHDQDNGGEIRRLTWLANPASDWGIDHPCFAIARTTSGSGIGRFLRLEDGSPDPFAAIDVAAITMSPTIMYGGGRAGPAGQDLGMSRLETPGFFDACGPTIVATISPHVDRISLSYSLLDFRSLAGEWPMPELSAPVDSDDL